MHLWDGIFKNLFLIFFQNGGSRPKYVFIFIFIFKYKDYTLNYSSVGF